MKKKALCLFLAVAGVLAISFAANAATKGTVIGMPGSANYQVEPARITLDDVMHIFETKGDLKSVVSLMDERGYKVTDLHKQTARIINARRIDNNHLVVRFAFGGEYADGRLSGKFEVEDFDVQATTYKEDNTDLVNGGKTKYFLAGEAVPTYAEAVEKYGSEIQSKPYYGQSGFYFILLDPEYVIVKKDENGKDVITTHNACGYATAKRICRWAKWDDTSYCFPYEYVFDPVLNKKILRNKVMSPADYTMKYPQANDVNFLANHPNF